jgi:hypothetical protein
VRVDLPLSWEFLIWGFCIDKNKTDCNNETSSTNRGITIMARIVYITGNPKDQALTEKELTLVAGPGPSRPKFDIISTQGRTPIAVWEEINRGRYECIIAMEAHCPINVTASIAVMNNGRPKLLKATFLILRKDGKRVYP